MIPDRIQARMEAAKPQFHRNEEPTKLVVDADSIVYKVAATTGNLEIAKRKFVQEALTLGFLADADVIELHLTPKHCTKAGRFKVIADKPYQGNRKSAKKPELVEPLRYVVGRGQLQLPDNIRLVFNDKYEADDSVVMSCTADSNSIFYSEDKDLDVLRNRKLCGKNSIVESPVSGLGWLAMKELARSKKLIGRGAVFFWSQMLMGDTADNITGLKRAGTSPCGPMKAYTLLQPLLEEQLDCMKPAHVLVTCTEQDIAKLVLGLYKDNGQNPIPEAWLLWLFPKDGYNVIRHWQSLGLFSDPDIGEWLCKMQKAPWFIRETK